MNQLFAVARLNEDGMKKADQIAYLFDRLVEDLVKVCPKDSAQFQIAQTKMEEACFYAKKSMATLPKNQLKGS